MQYRVYTISYSAIQGITMQYNTKPNNTMKNRTTYAILCNTMQHITMMCNTMQYQITRQYNFKNYAILYNTMQYHRIIFNCHTAMPYNTVKYHTRPCNTIQYPSLQHNMYHTIPYNTIKYNAILPLLSEKYICLISQETNCLIVILKSVLKSVL